MISLCDSIPLAIDVQKLRDHYGVPDVGLIPHAEIASVIGHPHGSSRYRSVTDAWRQWLVSNVNVDTAVVRSRGIKILTPRERRDESAASFAKGARQVGRSAIRAAIIPDEALANDSELRESVTHLRITTARMAMAMTSAVKALQPPPMPAALPRRSG